MKKPTSILVVDHGRQLRSVVRHAIAGDASFEVAGEAGNIMEALNIAQLKPVDLILIDIDQQTEDSMEQAPEAARILASKVPGAKLIAWTEHEEPRFISEMIVAGAVGYLWRGRSARDMTNALKWARDGQAVLSREVTQSVLAELSKLYRTSEERSEQLRASYLATVDSLAAALETKDDQTGTHAQRVRDYATIVTRQFNPALLDSESLIFGFLLHDVGKIGIPESILMKPAALDDSEWAVMRMHPEMGARILKSAEFLQNDALGVVLAHHERWDGTGYPLGLAGADIPEGARVFSVADAFDAMTSDRPYRAGMPVEKAVAEIRRAAGTQFQPGVVEAFMESVDAIQDRMAQDPDIQAEREDEMSAPADALLRSAGSTLGTTGLVV